jgi:hypothetical protein
MRRVRKKLPTNPKEGKYTKQNLICLEASKE